LAHLLFSIVARFNRKRTIVQRLGSQGLKVGFTSSQNFQNRFVEQFDGLLAQTFCIAPFLGDSRTLVFLFVEFFFGFGAFPLGDTELFVQTLE
jgi:hypothetical protein